MCRSTSYKANGAEWIDEHGFLFQKLNLQTLKQIRRGKSQYPSLHLHSLVSGCSSNIAERFNGKGKVI